MRNSTYTEYDDEQLFKLVQAEANVQAYEELYHRYWDVLWRFALRHQINTAEAQDTLQDIFAHLWVNRDSIHIKYKVRSYLYRAAVNQILKKVNRSQFIAAYIQTISERMIESGLQPEEIIYEKELQANLHKSLELMPEKMRAVFESSRLEGLSHEEIAQKYGISKETVKSQIKNALKIVRKNVHSLFFAFL